MSQYDIVINGGRYFDGSGAPSAIRHLAVRDGKVLLVSAEPIDPSLAS